MPGRKDDAMQGVREWGSATAAHAVRADDGPWWPAMAAKTVGKSRFWTGMFCGIWHKSDISLQMRDACLSLWLSEIKRRRFHKLWY